MEHAAEQLCVAISVGSGFAFGLFMAARHYERIIAELKKEHAKALREQL
jgi:hypothetical protein